jgi:phenylalanyl-tRNA synthetase beta chain
MQDLKLFEFGKTYLQKAAGDYPETEWLAIWLSGNIAGQHWQHKAGKADIFYLKGLIENIFRLCGLNKVKEITEGSGLSWKNGKTTIASMMEVDSARLKDFDIRQNVFYAEINIGALTQALHKETVRYRELPKYPAMKRDLALVLEQSIPYQDVAAIAKKQSWEALKDFELFDVFENEKLGKDKKSLALSFTFQLNDRTLTDEEVDKMMRQLITTYEQELNAIVRS